jgi:hypothetical protein
MNNEGQIKGIERNVPRAVSEEISTWETLNLRSVQGGWRPVGRKPVEISGITGTALHVHVIDTVRNLISINGSMLYFKNLETGITKTAGEIEGELLDINNLGKILVVSTTAGKYNYAYVNKLSQYVYIGYPSGGEVTQAVYMDDIQDKVRGDSKINLAIAFNEYTEKIKKEGGVEGWMFVRTAVELVDGTFIRPSEPVLLYLGDVSMNARVVNNGADNYPYRVYGFEFHNLVVKTTGLHNWAMMNSDSGIIAGIAIFGTSPVSAYPDISQGGYFNDNGQWVETGYINRSTELLSEIYKRQPTFWLLGRLSLSEIIANSNDKPLYPNYAALEGSELLDIEDSGWNTVSHHTSFVYDSRLITGNISTSFFAGYYSGGGALIEFEIETSLGDVIVRKSIAISRIPWFIAYPDTRATKVNIYYQDGSDWKRAFSKGLLKSEDNNLAYCWYNDMSSSAWNLDHHTISGNMDTYTALITDPANDPVVTLRDIKSTTTDPNRVQASEIDNPLVMPYKNSYQVGASSILGFAANGEPVSEGQFGEYPIYVFTGEGMYRMDVGADPFISSIRKINGEVCNSPKTIKNIGVGVIFTTDKGLMVINGLQVNSLSLNFEQELHNDYAVRHNPLYQKAIGLVKLGKPDRFVSTVPFMKYLVGSNIGYDYPNREIWVNNPDYPYSYVYSIDYKIWSKRDETFTTIVDDYPRYYAQQGRSCKNLSAKEGLENMNIFLLSNPVKIVFDSFKQFRRMVARGEFPVERMGFYLFGSIDGFSWAYAGGKEIASTEPVIPPRFEQVETAGVYQKSFIANDGRMYFIGSGSVPTRRLNDDGTFQTIITPAVYVRPEIVEDIYGRQYLMLHGGSVICIDSDGTIRTAYSLSPLAFHGAVQTLNGLVTFLLDFDAWGNGGILVSHEDGTVANVADEPLASAEFTSSFRWNGNDWFLGSALWRSSGGVFPNPFGPGGLGDHAEGEDGKLYFVKDVFGYDKGFTYRIATDNTLETINFGFQSDYLLRNLSFANVVDGKILYRIMHGDSSDTISYSLYRIDGSGNPVLVADLNLRSSDKGQDGKIYVYGPDGLYSFDGTALTNTGIFDSFPVSGATFSFKGKLYFNSTTTTYRLDDDGSIVDLGENLIGAERREIGDRLYFLTNDGIKYLDSEGVIKYTNITSNEFDFADVSEVDGRTYFMTNGFGIWYLDDDGDIKQTDLTGGNFRFFGYAPDGTAYFAAPGTMDYAVFHENRGIYRLTKETVPTVKAKDAIYLGVHKSVKYAALVIEGIVTHEWNLTHISETLESVMNKKLR